MGSGPDVDHGGVGSPWRLDREAKGLLDDEFHQPAEGGVQEGVPLHRPRA